MWRRLKDQRAAEREADRVTKDMRAATMLEPQREGCVKISYPSQAAAHVKLTRLARENRPECKAYECPHCGAWHLTSQR